MDDYLYGTDVLGDGFDSVAPWLKMFTGGFGGGGGDNKAAAAAAALAEQQRQAMLAMQAQQSRNTLIAVGAVAGVGMLGTIIYLVARR